MEELTCTQPSFIWSIEYLPDTVLIKYNYERDFAILVKTLPVIWDQYLKGWVAHKDFSDHIYGVIKHNFPEWKLIDKRTN